MGKNVSFHQPWLRFRGELYKEVEVLMTLIIGLVDTDYQN